MRVAVVLDNVGGSVRALADGARGLLVDKPDVNIWLLTWQFDLREHLISHRGLFLVEVSSYVKMESRNFVQVTAI